MEDVKTTVLKTPWSSFKYVDPIPPREYTEVLSHRTQSNSDPYTTVDPSFSFLPYRTPIPRPPWRTPLSTFATVLERDVATKGLHRTILSRSTTIRHPRPLPRSYNNVGSPRPDHSSFSFVFDPPLTDYLVNPLSQHGIPYPPSSPTIFICLSLRVETCRRVYPPSCDYTPVHRTFPQLWGKGCCFPNRLSRVNDEQDIHSYLWFGFL